MVKAAAQNDWLEEKRVALEILTSIKRAGANIILTYHAKDAARWLKEELTALEQASCVTVAVENMPCHFLGKRRLDVHRMNRVEEWSQLSHLTLDTTHLGTWGLDILDVYEQVADRVAHVHLSNFRDGQEHKRLDDGDLPLDAFLQRLRGRFQGTVAIELNPASLKAEDEDKVRAHLRSTVEFCRRRVG